MNFQNKPEFFLGATGENGFVNRFSEIYSNTDGFRAYIIKGGPGSGKSTFMKRIADDFADDSPIICRCSSDPQSLDAVILPFRRVMIADGTAPHVLEPEYPGARERILNFFDIFDCEQLYNSRDDVIEAFKRNADCHKAAGSYISAAGALLRTRLNTALTFCDKSKAEKYADTLSRKLLFATDKPACEVNMYIEAVTPDGYLCFADTPSKICDNVIAIDDDYSVCADIILNCIKENAKFAGHTVLTLRNPILPDITRGVIIPTANVAVVVSDFLSTCDNITRTVHTKRFYDCDELAKSRERLNFEKKGVKFMIDAAETCLRDAKITHDRLERFYISAADFEKLDDIYKKLISEF